MRVAIPMGTVAAAMLFTLAGPLSAQAAVGDLIWSEDSGTTHAVTNPEDGSCVTFKDDNDVDANAARVVNYTDLKLEVYKEANCAGPGVFTLDPDAEYLEGAASVKVWATNDAP